MSAPVQPAAADRVPPNNLDAEAALLGSIMVDKTLLEGVAALVRPSYFYNPLHESIFAAMLALADRGDPFCDKIAVANELRARKKFDEIGGMAYLNRLMDSVQTASSAAYYARLVREAAAARGLEHVGRKVREFAWDYADEIGVGLDRAERMLRELRERFDGGALRPATMQELRAETERRALEAPTWVLSSPFPTLNRKIGGFAPGLHGWSAAGKHGKTHATLLCALWDAKIHGVAMYHAAEGGRRKAYDALLEMLAGVMITVQGGMKMLGSDQRKRVDVAKAVLEEAFGRLWLYGSGDEPITSHQVVVEAKRQAARLAAQGERLASVWVDVAADLADVRGENGAAKEIPSTHERKKAAFRRLRDAAIALGIPFHVVDHQNSATKDARPSRNNVRDGGDLHLIAENLILIWRPDRDKDPAQGVFIIDASRSGHEGTIDMRYERGLWLDQDCHPPQSRAFTETTMQEALDLARPPLDPELLGYARTTLPPAASGPRTIQTDVDGQPARIVTNAHEEDLDPSALFGAP